MSTSSTRVLFGGPSHPWPAFRAVNDALRGGSSTSSFHVSPSNSCATIAGHLDITTLGGAGFASQCTSFSPSLSLPRTSTLLLTLRLPLSIPPSQPSKFVLALKNEIPGHRTDGRRESVLSYEYSFDLRELRGGEKGVVQLRASWGDFVPTFRGRERKDAEPIDPTKIYELSFMCRSDFGAQEGDFELVVCEMAEEEKEGKGGNRGWWRSLVEVVRGWMGSVSGWWRGDEAMRLP